MSKTIHLILNTNYIKVLYKIMSIARAEGGTNQTGQEKRGRPTKQGKMEKPYIQ